jgi:outer membrane protein OmpA-like peptidoglycan-associated protein
MKSKMILFVALILSQVLWAQTKNTFTKTPQSDCNAAVRLPIYKSFRYGMVAAPKGFGNAQEITSIQSDLTFAQEHHTAWYVLSFSKGGDFTFKINPMDSTNDYDFLLYKVADSLYCNQIKIQKIKPIRNNLSRNNLKTKGVTGLSIDATNVYSKPGPGAQFSKNINVQKGEQYVLLIDNVYKNGNGFSIDFELNNTIEIRGEVRDENGKPIIASVVLTDSLGNTITETQTNNKGTYVINTVAQENKSYQLNISGKNTFFETYTIKGNQKITESKTVLPTLKKGETYKLDNINFVPNSDEPLQEAFPAIRNLVKLMQTNPDLQIVIEGHVNGTTADGYVLSSEADMSRHESIAIARAQKVASFLKTAGINQNRYEIKGFGSRQMLFPNARTLAEQKANRRVEIRIK